MTSKKRDLCYIIVAALFLYWVGNWMLPVTDPVETNYTQTAKEMLLSGDFISPRIFGGYWYDKPIFFYWELIAAFSVFGVNDFAARMFPGIFGAIGLVMTYLFTQKIYDTKTARMATAILGTTFGYWLISKTVVTDLTLFVFFNAVLVFFYLAYTSEKKWMYYLCYIFAGLAVLTKGPIGLLLPGFIVTVFICLRRDFAEIKRMKPLGFILFFLVTMIWYAPMISLHGDDFVNNFLGVHNVLRATQSEHPMWNVWWYYSVLFFLVTLPWSFTLPMTLHRYIKAREFPRPDTTKLFLLVWALSIYIFYQNMATKYTTYTLPASLPIAILMARALYTRETLFKRVFAVWWVSLLGLTFLVAVPALRDYGYSYWNVGADLKARVQSGDLVINKGDYRVSIPYYSDLEVYQAETARAIEAKRPDGKSWNAKNVMPFVDIEKLPADRRIFLVLNNRYFSSFETTFDVREWEQIGDYRGCRLYVHEPSANHEPPRVFINK